MKRVFVVDLARKRLPRVETCAEIFVESVQSAMGFAHLGTNKKASERLEELSNQLYRYFLDISTDQSAERLTVPGESLKQTVCFSQ